MHKKLLPAITLFLACSAFAMEAPAEAPAQPAAGGMMHASLVQAAPARVAVAQPAPAAAMEREPAAQDKEQPAQERTTGMLLAGLALMLGIVLRRWGADRR